MEKQRVSFTEQIRIALSKPMWYKSLFRQSPIQHVGYFLILLLLVTAIQCIIPLTAYMQSVGGIWEFVYHVLPDFSLEDGNLYVSSVVDYENTGLRLIIDTSYEAFGMEDVEAVAEDMEDTLPTVYMVSRTNMVSNTVSIPFSLSSLGMNYNNDDLYSDMPLVLTIYIVFFVLRVVIGYVVSALFFSFFGALMNKALGLNIRFGQIFLIALYAKSLELILEAILEVVGISLLYYVGTIVGIFITCRYMTRGMTSLIRSGGGGDDEGKGRFTDFFV